MKNTKKHEKTRKVQNELKSVQIDVHMIRVLAFGKPQVGTNRRRNARNNLSTRMAHNFCSMRSFFKRKNVLESSRSQLSNAFFLLKNDLLEQKLWTLLVDWLVSGGNAIGDSNFLNCIELLWIELDYCTRRLPMNALKASYLFYNVIIT